MASDWIWRRRSARSAITLFTPSRIRELAEAALHREHAALHHRVAQLDAVERVARRALDDLIDDLLLDDVRAALFAEELVHLRAVERVDLVDEDARRALPPPTWPATVSCNRLRHVVDCCAPRGASVVRVSA